MAVLVDLLTLGEVAILSLDSDPRTGGGFAAVIGSFGTINNSGTPVGQIYVKTGAGNTAWELVSTTASSGTVSSGVAGSLALYPASGNNVDDVYVQNTQNINVSVASQPTRSAGITYNIPNPGDAVTSADFILSQGTQTIGGSKTFSSAVNMGSQKITSMADPTAAQDAATKAYVDAVAQGLAWKLAARVATTANLAVLSGLLTIDTITVISGDRVLVKNQTTQSNNGVYVAAAGAWTRAVDMDLAAEFIGAAVFVDEGAVNGDTAWVQTTPAPITVGTSNIVFVQFAGAGTYTAGNGLSLTGTQFAVSLATNSGLTFTGNQLDHLLAGTTLSKGASGLQVATGGITNTEVAAAANIARSKLASGSANHVLINDGTGVMSSEAQLAMTRGGTNASLTAAAGANVYSTATGLALSAVGTAGQALLSGGTGASTWFTGTGVVKATSGVLSTSNVSLTSEVTGILPIANGGTNSSTALNNNRVMISSAGTIIENGAITAGSVYFGAATTGLPAQDNTNFFWDNTNKRLGVGINAPTETLHVQGNVLLGTGSIYKQVAVTGINYFEAQGTVNTTDATVTSVYTYTVPTDTTLVVEARVIGRRTGGTGGTTGDASSYVRTARVSNIGGTVSLFNLQSDFTSEANNATNCIIDVSGTTFRIRATGAASNNYSWFAHVKVLNG